MHETSRDIARLQRLLDESYEKAGQHLRSIITLGRRLKAYQVCDELQGMTLLSLATVTARCEPIVSPVDGIFYKGLLWFGSAIACGKSTARSGTAGAIGTRRPSPGLRLASCSP